MIQLSLSLAGARSRERIVSSIVNILPDASLAGLVSRLPGTSWAAISAAIHVMVKIDMLRFIMDKVNEYSLY